MGVFSVAGNGFQSTLPVGGATLGLGKMLAVRGISIHAPRGGSDLIFMGEMQEPLYFNPRSPWGERLQSQRCQRFHHSISIHAPRGGSDLEQGKITDEEYKFQSTLPVGGATPLLRGIPPRGEISIHAPRGGSDSWLPVALYGWYYFNPRSPWGERQLQSSKQGVYTYFNPRSPWGERQGRLQMGNRSA